MREILLKTDTSKTKRRRSLLMQEIIQENGLIARAEKKYAYFIAEQREMPHGSKISNWMDSSAQCLETKPHHVFIKRVFDKETGIGQTKYRTSGRFYVVRKLKVFAIIFMHSVTFDMLGAKAPPTLSE